MLQIVAHQQRRQAGLLELLSKSGSKGLATATDLSHRQRLKAFGIWALETLKTQDSEVPRQKCRQTTRVLVQKRQT